MSNQRTLDQHFKMPPVRPRQFLAVTAKNWTLLYQSPFGLIGCVFVSILVVSLLGWLHQFYVSKYNPIDNNSEFIPKPMPVQSYVENINHHILFTLQSNVSAASTAHFGTLPEDEPGSGFIGASNRKWTDNQNKQLRTPFQIPSNISSQLRQSFVPFVTVDDLSCDQPLCARFKTFEELDENVNKTVYDLMQEDIDSQYQYDNKKKRKYKFQDSFTIEREEGKQVVNDYNMTNQFKWDKHEKLYTAAINFSYLNYPIDSIFGPRVNEIGYKYIISTYTKHQTQMQYGLTNFNHIGGSQYFLYQTFLRNTFQPHIGTEPPLIQGYQAQFWEKYLDRGADPFTPIFASFLIPIAFYSLVSIFTYQMSQEKGDGLLSLQQMMGLKYYPRYFADLVYQIAIAFLMLILIFGGCAITGMEFISHTYFGIWILIGILFVLNIPLLSQLLASITDFGRVSSILSIFIIIIEAWSGKSWVSDMYDDHVTYRTINMWYSLIPGMGPIVALSMINGLIVTQNPDNYLNKMKYFRLEKVSDGSLAADVGYETAWSIIIGFISLPIYSMISIYLDKISPRRYGISEHPLFFLQSLYERACVQSNRKINEITCQSVFWAVGQMLTNPKILFISQAEIDNFVGKEKNKSEECQNDDEDDELQTSSSFNYLKGRKDKKSSGSEHMSQQSNIQIQIQNQYKKQTQILTKDPELDAEKLLTIQGLSSTGLEPLVRLLNLTKTYPSTRYSPAKRAVRNMYYTIGKNECFCLLGANGCGKTTLINMLCMLFKPTHGTAYICGQSINDKNNQQLIQQNLGVCPQFDILYPTMTIRQHLLFYARIKGVHKSIQKEHITDLLEAVELSNVSHQSPRQLSGGMKRRLSFSIALCSKPQVLIFDEPSSGLDVATRRALWNVIIKARQGRAILLTTHAMEEAECLATRIAIMADGKLRSIGTPSGLQKRFGSGYQLTICVDKEKQFKNNGVYVQIGQIQLNLPGEQSAHQLINQKISKELILASCYQGTLVYIVPQQTKISDLWRKMEELIQDRENGISDWSLNQTSLESVFIKVASQTY
ncbi:ABC_transporter family protein [Hexamita inflata]|uniref:ABC transporter family protein n=1 Tax=Hexamita inflata TaxID=28002 RepID=A0AA86RML0_9EUKA|nr:ABC transporter family protein [Hexamita inflata]